MENQSFKSGDVVQLKSGGPKMTVEVVSTARNQVSCVWFTKDSTYNNKTFAINALELAAKAEPKPAEGRDEPEFGWQ